MGQSEALATPSPAQTTWSREFGQCEVEDHQFSLRDGRILRMAVLGDSAGVEPRRGGK